MVDRPATASTLCTVSSGQSFLTSLIPTSVGGATKVFDVDSALTDTAISGAYVDEIFFRYTKNKYGNGKKFFLMAPIHHHFELKGWPESRVVTRFWIIGILFALMSLTTFKVR